ncbi:MAG TPA: hypothetical protein VGF55_33980 [Gemmataceae bacterium]
MPRSRSAVALPAEPQTWIVCSASPASKEKFRSTAVSPACARTRQRRKNGPPVGSSVTRSASAVSRSGSPTRSSKWAAECGPTSSITFAGSRNSQPPNGPPRTWPSSLNQLTVTWSSRPSLPARTSARSCS